ncbi:hypothetical protein KEM55_001969 [Ascosphaera atra]|nr:hypothetical protein KEM55_001969 [Ascosphaera atra]
MQSPILNIAIRSTSSARQFTSSTQRHAIPSESASGSKPEEIIPLRKQLKDEAKAKKAAKRKGGKTREKNAAAKRLKDWELTVGIEIHAQLDTDAKLFSRASTKLEDAPNTNVALFDLAIPGSQPIFQKSTLIPALRAAIAFDCEIQRVSHFDRKHYFYQDQPSGYQITQYYDPYARNGKIWVGPQDGISKDDGNGVMIGINQVQMEQDTAKSTETPSGAHLLDFNRVSRPLIEVITLPQIHSPETAAAVVRKIQTMLQSVGAVTTGMEMGGLRADVNVSVRRRSEGEGAHGYHGINGLGQRTEIKNLSSFKAVEDAVRAEMNRQISVLESGGVVEGETRGWTIGSTETRKLRGKEGEVDYRYMPDPDIAPVIIGDGLVQEIRQRMPELPDAQLDMLMNDERYGLSLVDGKALMDLDDGSRLEYYQDAVDAYLALQGGDGATTKGDAKMGRTIGNWVLHELGGLFSKAAANDPETVWSPDRVRPEQLAGIIHLQQTRQVTSSSAKQLLALLFNGKGNGRTLSQIIDEENMRFVPMTREELVALAEKVIAAKPETVKQIREKGQMSKIGFFVGQMMRKGEKGRVEARAADEVLKELLLGGGTA